MGFRTVEITGPAELHVRQGLLIIEKERKTLGIPLSETDSQKQKKTRTGTKGKRKPAAVETVKISVPLEDIRTLVCMGASVRISTMAMAQLCQNKITTMMLDEKYRPAGILQTSMVPNPRIRHSENFFCQTVIFSSVLNCTCVLLLIGKVLKNISGEWKESILSLDPSGS